MECYWNSTRRKEERVCKVCGKRFWATRPLLKHGYGIFCSRECQHKTYPERIIKFCKQCEKRIEVWPSKVHLTKFCSKDCADSYMRDYVSLVCMNCRKPFQLPRSDFNRGRGKFCSYGCFIRYTGPSTLEEKMRKILQKTGVEFEREYKFGRFRADFFIKKLKLVIECDGEYWHMREIQKDRDRRKDRYLKELGYKILRLSGHTILGSSNEELKHIILSNFS